MRDSSLNKLGADIVMFALLVDYPPGKVGAIQKMRLDPEQLKLLKSRHFQQPKK